MQPANFQSTIFSFTCANIRTSVQSGQVGGTEGGDWVIDCQQATGCCPDAGREGERERESEMLHNAD